MTSRERVLCAVNHKQADRMPIDFGGSTSTGISIFAYARLLDFFGYPKEPVEVADMIQLLPRMRMEVLQRFHSDCVMLKPDWTAVQPWSPRPGYDFLVPASAKLIPSPDGAWTLEHRRGRLHMPARGYFFDGSWARVDERDDDAYFMATAAEAKRLYRDTDYYIGWAGFPSYFSQDPDWLCELMLDPQAVAARNRAALDGAKDMLLRLAAECGDAVQEVRIADDMGGQRGPMCRPEVMEREIMPFYKEFCDFVHENSPYKVHLHNCGSILPLIPMLADSGIDILDPIQISAENMAPADIKKAASGKIALWGGGVDTQNILGKASPGEVVRNVRKLVDAFKPGGGYVFAAVHNIQGDVPPQNIAAVYDAAYGASSY